MSGACARWPINCALFKSRMVVGSFPVGDAALEQVLPDRVPFLPSTFFRLAAVAGRQLGAVGSGRCPGRLGGKPREDLAAVYWTSGRVLAHRDPAQPPAAGEKPLANSFHHAGGPAM